MSCTRRAVSEEPTGDFLKRSGDIVDNGPLKVKRARLSDFRGLDDSSVLQKQAFSNDSDSGGVICATKGRPAGVSPDNADALNQISVEAQTSCVISAFDQPPIRLLSFVEGAPEPLPANSNDGVRQGIDGPATKNIRDIETSSDKDAPSPTTSSRCPAPGSGVQETIQSMEDSEGMWTSVTSEDSSEDRGVEIGLDEGHSDNTPQQTCTSSTSPVTEQTTSLEKAFDSFMKSIKSACSVLQEDLDAKKRSDVMTMGELEDMLAMKDNIIHLLQNEVQYLRAELERCKQLVYQHGKETEEWASRMMELICRLPGHERIC